jgi:hypothetical protein
MRLRFSWASVKTHKTTRLMVEKAAMRMGLHIFPLLFPGLLFQSFEFLAFRSSPSAQ